MVGNCNSSTRSLVVRFFAAGRAVAEVVVILEDGLQKGGPFLFCDELMPLVDLLVAAEGAEFVEKFGKFVRVVEDCLLYTSPSPRDRG